jgi:hypothetical protein
MFSNRFQSSVSKTVTSFPSDGFQCILTHERDGYLVHRRVEARAAAATFQCRCTIVLNTVFLVLPLLLRLAGNEHLNLNSAVNP